EPGTVADAERGRAAEEAVDLLVEGAGVERPVHVEARQAARAVEGVDEVVPLADDDRRLADEVAGGAGVARSGRVHVRVEHPVPDPDAPRRLVRIGGLGDERLVPRAVRLDPAADGERGVRGARGAGKSRGQARVRALEVLLLRLDEVE